MSCIANSVVAVARSPRIPTSSPALMLFCLVGADSIGLAAAVLIAGGCKWLVSGPVSLGGYLRLWPFLPAFLLLYLLAGLYSSLPLSPPEELSRATICSSLGFVMLSIATLSFRGGEDVFRPTLIVAILLSVVLVPLLRAQLRTLAGARDWWGYPAVLFGPHNKTRAFIHLLQNNPQLGLKPIAIVSDDEEHNSILGVPVVRGDSLSWIAESRASIYAVIMADASRAESSALQLHYSTFSHVLAIPDAHPLEANMWISSRAVGRFLALEMKRNLLQPPHLAAKRALDLVLAATAGIVFAPLLVLIALCVRLTSKGPVLYHQQRIGRHGKRFRAYKFRTMLVNAEEALEKHLEEHPDLRAEWVVNHKLRNDPRVTPIGRFLRRTSFDELPQLWNIFKGEMSLVGPRPIVDAEIVRYGESFHLYTSVSSGLTGLWQVSGRSDTSYEDRVALDEYYVRNWSIWLDVYILCRTVNTLLSRKGAY